MEALEDLAGVIGYAGSGSMCITSPSVFLAVNWSDFFSALFDQAPDMQVPGLLTLESGQMVAPGPSVRLSETAPRTLLFPTSQWP